MSVNNLNNPYANVSAEALLQGVGDTPDARLRAVLAKISKPVTPRHVTFRTAYPVRRRF